MIFSGIIFILCWLPSEMNSSDDSFEILSVNTGEIATFLCDLPERYSNQPAEFYAPGGRLLGRKSGENLPRRYTLEHTYAWTWSLIISDVSDDDAGEYTCRVLNSNRTLTIIKRFNLTVLTPPKIVDITIESNHHGILLENEQVILKCLTRANPPAKILWIYSMEDSSSIRNNIVIYDNQLFILNFSRTTPANYQCIADNGIPPRDTRTSHLVPAIPPEVTIQSYSTRLSSQMIFNCTIIARPLSSVKWRHNRREITNNIQRIQINDYTIQLILLIHIDSADTLGMYECEAENQFKIAKAFVNIDGKIIPWDNEKGKEVGYLDTIRASPMTTRKKQYRSSSPSYAQVEILLNRSWRWSIDESYLFTSWLIIILFNHF